MLNWYLVYTKPRHEDSVAAKFDERGFEVLNPKIKARKFVRRKFCEVSSPFFPTYIFIRFDDAMDYRNVKYARGVKNVVGFGGQPAVVHEGIIGSIKARMEDGVITLNPRKFNRGDEVIIHGGGFEGFRAVFKNEVNGIERVSILLKSAAMAHVVIDGRLLTKV